MIKTPPAPAYRHARRSVDRDLVVNLKTITPILGGGAVARRVDPFDPIRVPAIRGHLRSWWRALHAPNILASFAGRPEDRFRELHKREIAIWGGLSGQGATRSAVDITVEVEGNTESKIIGGKAVADERDGTRVKDDIQINAPGAYALFPGRAEGVRKDHTTRRVLDMDAPPAQRIQPSLSFTVRLSFRTDSFVQEVQSAVRAWILFGGIGARTRRGCGSLALQKAEAWLPQDISSVRALFHECAGHASPTHFGTIAGARFGMGRAAGNVAVDAWLAALDWVRNFRQAKAPSHERDRDYAREAGVPAGVSNWPEPDKLRHLGLINDGHRVRPGLVSTPFETAWPRAVFGLPIIFEFPRSGEYRRQSAELVWAIGEEPKDRLASPLIVKAVQLAGGDTFAPFALWLHREVPPSARVFIKGAREKTEAPLHRTKGRNDRHQFNALQSVCDDSTVPAVDQVREAFFRSLKGAATLGSF